MLLEEMTLKSLKASRRIVWAFFLFGAGATIMINLAYADSGWGPKLLSVVAPISLLGVVEILGRVPFKKSWIWTTLKYLLTLLVGGSALFVSYFHIAHLALQYNMDPLVAWIQPIVTDGMMILAAMALISIKGHMDAKMEEARNEREEEKLKEEMTEQEMEELRQAREIIEQMEAAQIEAKKELEATRSKLEEYVGAENEKRELYEGMDHLQKESWERNQARAVYQESVITGEPVDANYLAKRFTKSETWAQLRIDEVNHEMTPVQLAAVM